MPEGEPSPEATGYTGVLGKIVDGLKSQPALLFGLGGGIVLLGLSTVIGAQAWLLVLGIVLVLLAALGAWVLGSRNDGNRDGATITGRNISARGRATIGTRKGASSGRFAPRIRAKGDITATDDAHVGSEISEPGRPQPGAEE